MLLQAVGITKIFRSVFSRTRVRALDDVSFKVNNGDILCVKGANGSGKSTLLRISAGLVLPTSGKVICDLSSARASGHANRIGYCPDQPVFWGSFTAYQFLRLIMGITGVTRGDRLIAEWLELMELSKWKDEPVRMFSKGMVHKLALIAAVIDDPVVIIVDEPFSSLDESSKDVFSRKLLESAARGAGVLISDPSVDTASAISSKTITL